METIGVYPLAPLPGRQDSLASQAKTPISGTITKTHSNAAQSLLQIRRVVLSRLAQTLVHAILTRNTKQKPRTYLSSVSKPFKSAEKKSRAFAQLFKNLLQQIYICVLHAKLVCTLVGAYCNVDLVALDRSAGVLSDEHAVALDEYAAAERNDGRVNCDRAAFGQGGAGSGQCQIVAVAFNARIVEGQFIIAKRSGICLDGIACQIRCRVSYRTGGGCTCDQLVVSGLGCSGLDLGFLLSCFFSGLFCSLSLLSSFLLRLLGSILLCLECGSLCA